MLDDQQLLARYVKDGSEAAFGELVARHVNGVYSTALRRMNGDADLARDVAQLVFTDLARKAGSLPRGVVLSGWLHRASRYAAAQLLRTERRRHAREQEALAMNALENEQARDWEQIRPSLDAALDELSATDRDAVLLRFLEQRTLAEVGAALGSNEDAARKRVGRALDKLRAALVRRGVKTAVIPLSAALTLNSIQAAPAGLAAALATESLGAAAGAGTTLTLLKLMTTTKIKAGLLGTVAAAGVTASVLVHQANAARLHDAAEQMRVRSGEIAQLANDNERLTGLAAANEPSASGSLDELQRLRNEAAQLRSQANQLPQLRKANAALKSEAAATAPRKTPLQLKEETVEKMNATKEWLLAFLMYADDHQSEIPANLQDATPYLKDKDKGYIDGAVKQFEQVYRGSTKAITNAMNTIVLREREAWQTPDGRWSRVYGFADGHVEVHSEPNNDFAAWENPRLIPPPDDQKP